MRPEDDVRAVAGRRNLRNFSSSLSGCSTETLMPVSFQTFTHFSEAVVAFVAVNPDNQLTFFNFARAEAENIIVVSADSARMRAPVLIFIYPSFWCCTRGYTSVA